MDYSKILQSRWSPLAIITFLLIYGSIYYNYIAKTDKMILLISYSSILILSIVFNFVRITFSFKRKFKAGIFNNIPTTAAFVRLIISSLLSISFFSLKYSAFPAFIYLSYMVVIITTYDRYEYHQKSYRSARFIIDYVLAIMIFYWLDGISNVGWIAFLLPLCNMARHHDPPKTIYSILVTIIIIIFISVLKIDNIFILQNEHFASVSTVNLKELFLNFGKNFDQYINYKNNPSHYANWLNFKALCLSLFIIIMVPSIFLIETKKRLNKVFTFTADFSNRIINFKKDPSFLCDYLIEKLNAEIIIICTNNSIHFSTQNTNKNKRIIKKTYEPIRSWVTKWQENRITNHNQVNNQLRNKLSKKLNCLFSYVEIDNIQISDNYRQESNLLNELHTILAKNYIEIINDRNSGKLYDDFRIASCVPFCLDNTSLMLVINNFPTKYMIVPRPFFEDDLRKISAVQNLLPNILRGKSQRKKTTTRGSVKARKYIKPSNYPIKPQNDKLNNNDKLINK